MWQAHWPVSKFKNCGYLLFCILNFDVGNFNWQKISFDKYACQMLDSSSTIFYNCVFMYYINKSDNISKGSISPWLQMRGSRSVSTDLIHRCLSLWWICNFMVTTSQWSVRWIPMAMAAVSQWKWPVCTSLLPGYETQFRAGLIHVWPTQG